MQLDDPILTFPNEGDTPNDQWTLRNAVEGIQIFGGIGSGKTSGSGATLAQKYLSLGFGGLVLTVKSDEKEQWVNYCQSTGRINDLLILEPSGAYQFDFLDYEHSRSGLGAGLTDNIVNVLKTVIRSQESSKTTSSNDAFWEDALDMLLFNTIDLAQLAFERINIKGLYDIVKHLPKKKSEVVDPTSDANDPFAHILRKAMQNFKETKKKRLKSWINQHPNARYNLQHDHEMIAFKRVLHYFNFEFPGLSDRVRSIIEHSF